MGGVADDGLTCGPDEGWEVLVICAADYLGKVTAGPEYVALQIGAPNLFKGGDFFVFRGYHNVIFSDRGLILNMFDATISAQGMWLDIHFLVFLDIL